MSSEERMLPELLAFFKALADENRLKIVGLLAQQPYSVEKLAEALGIGVSTASHHLSKLAKAGLVRADVDGHYYIYSLQTDNLHKMAERLLKSEDLPRLSIEPGEDAFERKTLSAFLDSEGRIKSFPMQEKKFLVLLKYVSETFEPGIRYTEKQVNEILSRFNEDTALLRRNLIDYGLMKRESSGRSYWRTEPQTAGES